MLQNFKRLATGLVIGPLLDSIIRQPELWGEITARQETPGSAHRYTEAIFLRWPKLQTVDAAFNEITAVDYPAIEKLPEARELIAGVVNQVEGISLGRVLIASLQPDSIISKHADEGKAADHYERFHIPLLTQVNNEFYSEVGEDQAEMVHMKEGELWWFNHKAPHWLYNGGNTDRIHLVMDIVAPKYRRERNVVSA